MEFEVKASSEREKSAEELVAEASLLAAEGKMRQVCNQIKASAKIGRR